MANIIPKLNLNKTPNIVDPNSLIFAKNIRLDVDGTIHKDYSIKSLNTVDNVVYNDLIERIINDLLKIYNNSSDTTFKEYCNIIIEYLHKTSINDFRIVGEISDNNTFYIFIRCSFNEEDKTIIKDFILNYNEKDRLFRPCNCNWNYSEGKITGCVINNLYGDKILIIGETSINDAYIPLKCINTNKSNYTDDESLYTQTPNIPFVNLNYIGSFDYSIPNGVYQFFVRYKVRDGFYTDWFPASKELFAGNTQSTITNFGTLKYVNEHLDSDKSFVLDIEVLFNEYTKYYESFQIGFIVSHDDTIYARGWKHFNLSQTSIKFDYNPLDAEELEVEDFTKVTYNLFNIGNITNFKNKLYVSNYNETNFNEDFQSLANTVVIQLGEVTEDSKYNGYDYIQSTINGKNAISALIIDSNEKQFIGTNGIIYSLLHTFVNKNSIYNFIKDALYSNQIVDKTIKHTNYGISVECNKQSLLEAKTAFEQKIKQNPNFINISYFHSDEITNITVNGVNVELSSNADKDSITENILNIIYRNTSLMTYDGLFYNNSGYDASSFLIILTRPCSYQIKTQTSTGEITSWIDTSFTQTINIKINGDPVLVTNNDELLINNTTLIPFQKYKFFIHYVKPTGETTNGYYCGGPNAGIITVPYKNNCKTIIYPKFNVIFLPKGYTSYFFSIQHYSTKSSTIFNITKDGNNSEASSVEMNTRLIPFSKVTAKDGNSEYFGKYYYSGDSSSIRYFGADGIIRFEKDINSKILYAVNDYETQSTEDSPLIKCTPYIKPNNVYPTTPSTYDNYKNLNLLGYICNYSPLDRNRCIDYYMDGTSIYKKNNNAFDTTGTIKFIIKELSKFNDAPSDIQIKNFDLINTNIVTIYSNYNLNYLSLNEDIKESIKSYYESVSTATSLPEPITIICRLLTSLTLSSVYKLSSMYKSYPRKTYNTYSSDNITRFENTIRSSILTGDESKTSVFKFNTEDYYNVPTNKGIIINMVSVGDSIIVHTQDSMFRFTGNNTLTADNGNVTTQESQPFDTGISEIFGSEFGFAGLQNKDDHIITESGYIFFDRDSNIIYMYSGQNQLTKISESIEKLFRYDAIKDVYFANDYYNNRFFISILFENGNTETLSFSLINEIRSFISLHDFSFTHSFNTKTNCYFITEDKDNICNIDKQNVGIYEYLDYNKDKLYPVKYITENVNYKNVNNQDITKTYNKYYSIIDVIFNPNYELIKTLNSITWISNQIESEFKNFNIEDISTFRMSEPIMIKSPCDFIRVYSDTTITELLNTKNSSNDRSLNDLNSYKLPRYNQGKWTLNYFRDIQNIEDEYNYLKKYDDGRTNATLRSDNNSLIEGKYFVIRFLFSNSFKLETLEVNYSNKL